jgi:hypothetical protein
MDSGGMNTARLPCTLAAGALELQNGNVYNGYDAECNVTLRLP